MRAGTNAKIVIGFWDLYLVKEYIRHLRIIMLTGMNEDFGMVFPELPRDRGAFDELRPCTDNRDDLHYNSGSIIWIIPLTTTKPDNLLV